MTHSTYFNLLAVLILLPQTVSAQVNIEEFPNKSDKVEKSLYYYELGLELYQENLLEKSVKYFDSAISLNLRQIEYYVARAEANETQGEYIAALVDYETAIKIDFYDPNLRFKRGIIQYKLKNYQQSIADYDFILQNGNFNETTAIIFKGVQHNEGGRAEFAGINTLDKMEGDVYNARAQSYVKLNENQKALNDFQLALDQNSKEPTYHVNRGLCYLNMKDTVLAKRDFISALTIQPGFKSALFNLAKISSAKERENLNKELYADNEVSVVFSQRAYNKFLSGEYRSALKDYDSALFWMPKNADDLMNRGIVKSKLKRPKSAIADFERSLKLDKTIVRNYFLIGNALQVLRSYEEAVDYYKLYLLQVGPDAQVLYNKGVAEMKLGNNTLACEDLTLAFNLGEALARKPMQKACE